MNRLFITIILSAVVILSSCSAQEINNTDISAEAEQTEATSAESVTASTDSITTAAAPVTKGTDITTANTDTVTTENTAITTPQTETTLSETASSPKYPHVVEIPVTYHSFGEKKGKVCRSVMDGMEYEDFPAKEDIEPAIKCAYDVYFSKTTVWHMGENHTEEELPCAIENLSFASGLYLDFNGDGEKESLIVVKNDSDVPFAGDSIVVYYRNEFDNEALEHSDKLEHGSCASSYIHALIYDDCVDVIAESFFGASGQAFTVYSYDNGFKKEFDQGKGDVSPVDTYLISFGFYNALNGDSPTYYIRTDNGYALVGKDEIELDALTEIIPETQTVIEMIEDIYGEEIYHVKTEGFLNFFFCVKDRYITAYIRNGVLYSYLYYDRSAKNLDYYLENWAGEVVYGLCLL